MSEFPNRIRDHLCDCGSRARTREPSTADKLLAAGDRLVLEVWKCHDGQTELEFKLSGSLSTGGDDDDGDTIQESHTPAELRRLAAALLGEFTTRREGGDA